MDTAATAISSAAHAVAEHAPDHLISSTGSFTDAAADVDSQSTLTNSNLDKENDWIFSELYSVTIRVQCAEDLVAADINGKSDPYVKLTCGGETRKSSVIRNTLTPTWNESLDFVCRDRPQKLHIQVKDRSVLRDKSIGEAELDLAALIHNATQNATPNDPLAQTSPINSPTNGSNASNRCSVIFSDWLTLTGVAHGRIQLRIEFSLIPTSVGRTDELSHLDAVEDLHSLIELEVISGHHLKTRDLISKGDVSH